jgi:hypothetical protein
MDGGSFQTLWQLSTPQGISGATIAQGQTSTGKLYFDVTGADPMGVMYTGAGARPLMWCGSGGMMNMPEGMMAMPMATCPCPM